MMRQNRHRRQKQAGGGDKTAMLDLILTKLIIARTAGLKN